jgi:uncharacterized protein (UPF0264 family)
LNTAAANPNAAAAPGVGTRGPRLLVSVRNVTEARAAVRGGADWIDLKEPRRGALGAVDADVAEEVVAYAQGRTPVSAAGGELVDWCDGKARDLLNVSGISLIKLGLADCRDIDWESLWLEARRDIVRTGRDLVAVAYADAKLANAPPVDVVVKLAADAKARWLLLDTFDKSAGALGDYFGAAALRELLSTARGAGLAPVVAGSLNAAAIEKLPLELIDVVAVRGAACKAGRTSAICAQRVAELRSLLAAAQCA